ELAGILVGIADVAIEIAAAMRMEQKGYAGTANVYGEKQLQLDVFANDLFVESLRENVDVSAIASEELEEAVEGFSTKGKYAVAFDPLDGSSLVDANL